MIQCQTIVRCRSCRTYINPFVYFVDQRRWKCNRCFRVNDCEYFIYLHDYNDYYVHLVLIDWDVLSSTFSVPDEFQYDPISNSYGDPSRRPEVKNATIEFIAPAEYMVGIMIKCNTRTTDRWPCFICFQSFSCDRHSHRFICICWTCVIMQRILAIWSSFVTCF